VKSAGSGKILAGCFSDVFSVLQPGCVGRTVICAAHKYLHDSHFLLVFCTSFCLVACVPTDCMPETHRRGTVVLRRVVVGALSAMRAWRVVLRPTHCAGSAGLEAFRTLLTI
jgi:hypothetical protein